MRAWVCLPPVHTCAYIIQVSNEAQDDLGDRLLPADEPCSYVACLRDIISDLCHLVLCNLIVQMYTACTHLRVCFIRTHKSLCTPHRAVPARTVLVTAAACMCACSSASTTSSPALFLAAQCSGK